MRKYIFKVEINFEDPQRLYSKKAVRNYIHDAIRGWAGQFRPDDPLFGLSRKQILVGKLKSQMKMKPTGHGNQKQGKK